MAKQSAFQRGSAWTAHALETRWPAAALILIGLILRLLWWGVHGESATTLTSEAANVARTLFATGSFADPYRAGQGPTAHLMPLSPMITAGVYKVFGFETSASHLVSTFWSLGLVFISFWFFYLTFERLRSPPLARLIALATLCIVPLNFSLEVLWFRTLEGALAVGLEAVLLFHIVKWDGVEPSWSRVIFLAALLALVFMVQPNIGVAAVLALAIFAWRNIPTRKWAATVLIAFTAVVLVFAPWVVRNQLTMHSPILLRDNLGLEMALGFHEKAATSSDQRQTYVDRLKEIHPSEEKGYAAMQQAGGEVVYAKLLKSETESWMMAHPIATLRIFGRHLREYFFPPLWYWTVFSDAGTGNYPKMLIISALSLLGIAGMVLGLVTRGQLFVYPVIFLVVSALPYGLVQPTLRYRYLIFALLIYFAADAVGRVFQILLIGGRKTQSTVRPVSIP